MVKECMNTVLIMMAMSIIFRKQLYTLCLFKVSVHGKLFAIELNFLYPSLLMLFILSQLAVELNYNRCFNKRCFSLFAIV
jgi:hypothetical protein